MVALANTDPRFIAFFCAWFRHFFVIDDRRFRLFLYLHAGLDIDPAIAYWSALTSIPPERFGKPYRAVPDGGIRHSKHVLGCATVRYTCVQTHRALMGLVHALLAGPGIVRWDDDVLRAILRDRLPG